jgi:type IV secretion system protein TrbL
VDIWHDAVLRKADIGDFFAEFTRFIIFTGFYFWLLTNAVSGHNIAGTIIASMQQLGGTAAGLPVVPVIPVLWIQVF